MPYYSFYIYEQTGIHTSQQGLAGSESQGGRSQNSSERDILQRSVRVKQKCTT